MLPADKKAQKAAQKEQQQQQRDAAEEATRLQDLEATFWATAYGQARIAKHAGDKFFLVEIALDATTRATSVASTIGTTSRKYTGHGRTIGYIENEGWELVHAGFVFKETGQVSRDKFLSSGQQVSTTGLTVGVYLFRATDLEPRTDEVWKAWAEKGPG